jgi:hypothetical protein
MFQPASLQALARSLQILSDPRGAFDLYVWAARRARAIDARLTLFLVVDSVPFKVRGVSFFGAWRLMQQSTFGSRSTMASATAFTFS